jgi:hypothetical protein
LLLHCRKTAVIIATNSFDSQLSVDLGQHGLSMPQNGTLCSDLTQGNILNGQQSLPAKPTMPSYNFPTVSKDNYGTMDYSIPQFFIDNL